MPKLRSIKEDLKEFRKKIVSLFQNRSGELPTFEEAKRRLKIQEKGPRTFEEGIEVDKIVGGLEQRKKEFDEHFMPKYDTSKTKRLEKAYLLSHDVPHLPPVELRKVGDVYFVVDGHHRVSMAKKKGRKYIDAYVTEYESRVPLTKDYLNFKINEKRLKFLERTNIDKLRPNQEIKPTLPEGYKEIEKHIAIHMYNIAQSRNGQVTVEEAVKSWYDDIYKPITELIKEYNILEHVDGERETDVYIWIMNNWLKLWEKWRDSEPTEITKELMDE